MNWENYWILIVFVSAFAHAMWNFLLKQSEEKQVFLWFLRISSFIILIPLTIIMGAFQGVSYKSIILWGGGSILLHSLYAIILAKAYTDHDFSIVYPIARGTAPLFVVIMGSLLLKEEVQLNIIIGALSIFLGIYFLYSRKKLREFIEKISKSPLPILVGTIIAGYTVFDKMAVSYIQPVLLVLIETAGQVVFLGFHIRKRDKELIVEQWKKSWYKMVLAGFFSGMAYLLILIVLTKIQVSLVTPLRETSIIIGSLLGFCFLKEKISVKKIVGTIVIFIGVLIIIS